VPPAIWIVAHIVGERSPGLLSWLAALLLWGSAAAALFTHGLARRCLVVTAMLGLAGSAWDLYERGQRPRRPDLVIQLVQPARQAFRPLAIQVCGRTTQGGLESPTANGRFMLVRLDGVQVAEVHQSAIFIPVSPGRHLLSVEINSPYHQEFQPPLLVTRYVQVRPAGHSVRFKACGPSA